VLRVVAAAMVLLAADPMTWAQDAGVIASMDEMRFTPPGQKGSASLVDGRVGKAVRFRFEADARSAFLPVTSTASRSGTGLLGFPSGSEVRVPTDSPAWSSFTTMTSLFVTTSAFR